MWSAFFVQTKLSEIKNFGYFSYYLIKRNFSYFLSPVILVGQKMLFKIMTVQITIDIIFDRVEPAVAAPMLALVVLGLQEWFNSAESKYLNHVIPLILNW